MTIISAVLKAIPFDGCKRLAKIIEWEQKLSPSEHEVWLDLCCYAGRHGLSMNEITGKFLTDYLKQCRLPVAESVAYDRNILSIDDLFAALNFVFIAQKKSLT